MPIYAIILSVILLVLGALIVGYLIGSLFTTLTWQKINLATIKDFEQIHKESMSEMEKIIADQNKKLLATKG